MEQSREYRQEGYLNEDFRFFHLNDKAGQERDFHFHDFDKIVILLSGSVSYLVEDAVCPMEAGDIVLIKHHTIHRAEIDRSVAYDRVIIYIAAGYIDRSAPDGKLMSCFDSADSSRHYIIRPGAEASGEIMRLLRELEVSLTDGKFGSQVLTRTLLLQLLIQINRASEKSEGQTVTAQAADPRIRSALSYINENFARELTVEDLASRVYMSRYHFMRLFKAQTGFTVHGYLRQRRLLRACQLIREGTPAMKAASECGFGDYSAFHRAFRSEFSVSPSDLQRK